MIEPDVRFHIEKLVLHGFPPGSRYRIAEAVEKELTRLFAERGVPISITENREADRLDGGLLRVASGDASGKVGVNVARSVYSGIAQWRHKR